MTLQIETGYNLNLKFKKFNDQNQVEYTVVGGKEQLGIPALVRIEFPLEVDNNYPAERFNTFLFFRKNQNENDIFQVFDNKNKRNRLGWCFPIQALCSRDHSFAENEHFLPYATAASKRIFQDMKDDLEIVQSINSDSEHIFFSDFFSEDIAIFVIDVEAFNQLGTFSYEEWFPSFFRHGYIPYQNHPGEEIIFQGIPPEGRNIYISPVSSYLKNQPFLYSVFTKLIPYEENPLLLFFYEYQLIELLLEYILMEEQRAFVQEVIKVVDNTVKTKEILRKINENTTEKKLIRLLFSDYTAETIDSQTLKDTCNSFLLSTNSGEEKEPHKALYLVRNIIFHQYRNAAGQPKLLNAITREFADFLAQTIIFFEFSETAQA